MISYRARGIQTLHCMLQVVAASVLYWVWTLFVIQGVFGINLVGYRYVAYSFMVGAGLIVDRLRANDTKVDFFNIDFIDNCAISFRQTVTVLVVLLLFLVGSKDTAISRAFLFSFILPLFFLFLYSNRIFPRFLSKFAFSGKHLQNTILLGAAGQVDKLNLWLTRKSFYGVKPVGLVTDDPVSESSSSLPLLGSTDGLARHIRSVAATQVIAVGLSGAPDAVNSLADTCQRLGVRLLIVSDFERLFGRKITLIEDDGLHLISFHREPLECPFNRSLKRALDLMIAVPVVIFILPVTSLFVWIIQRIQSPGPLFFRQRRTGMRDEEFLIYKYRTMNVDNHDETVQATKNDSRVYRAGRWLRKLSIDEIPQFINVLTGEMSVVGPRPHLREHDEAFTQTMNSYRVRSFIKPGITGLAQVRDFRGETITPKDVVDRVESDIHYLENWSFLLDGMIVLRTVWKVFAPAKTSY